MTSSDVKFYQILTSKLFGLKKTFLEIDFSESSALPAAPGCLHHDRTAANRSETVYHSYPNPTARLNLKNPLTLRLNLN